MGDDRLTPLARQLIASIDDRRPRWDRWRERRWPDAQRAHASSRRLRRLVSRAAANVLTVRVPSELSLHDTLLYLERPEIAAEAARLAGLAAQPAPIAVRTGTAG